MRNFFYLLFCFLILNCSVAPYHTSKINGVSFVASRSAIDSSHVKPLINVNANSAAIMPFGFIRDLSHPEIIYNTDRQWFGETRAGAKQYVKELQRDKFTIMIKPQIWIWHGEFTGDLNMNSEEDWKLLETSYSNFILEYAELAQEVNAEIFCIGTELGNFIEKRPMYWTNLILEIKEIYKGKLTYAANWDEYRRTPFWQELDLMGIDAYFPVSEKKTPTFEDCLEGWKRHKLTIQEFSERYNKPVLFTEYGYRSVDFSGKEPWKADRSMTAVNLKAQENTTKALFETFWFEDWFAGGFIWKWFIAHEEVGGLDNNQFTPQNKPVEKIIQSYYKNNN